MGERTCGGCIFLEASHGTTWCAKDGGFTHPGSRGSTCLYWEAKP